MLQIRKDITVLLTLLIFFLVFTFIFPNIASAFCSEWGPPEKKCYKESIDANGKTYCSSYDFYNPCIKDTPGDEGGCVGINCLNGSYACGSCSCCPNGPTSGGGGVDIPCSSRTKEYYLEKGTVFIAADDNMGAKLTWECRGINSHKDNGSCGQEFGHLHLSFSQSVNGADCKKATVPTAWCPLGKQPIFIPPRSKSYTVDPTKGAYPLLPGKRYYFAITYHMDECHPDGSASFLTTCNIQTSQKNITTLLKDTPTLSSGVSSIGTWKVRYYTSDPYTVSVTKPVPTATPKPGKTPIPRVNYIDVATYPYSVTLYPIKTTGATPVKITQNVIIDTGKTRVANPVCSDSSLVTVIESVAYEPWWQVKNSDVMSSSNIDSVVPAGKYFSLAGAEGFPGVTAYGTTTNLTNANSSAKGWLVNSAVTNAKTFSYDSFYNQVPSDITINPITSADSVLDKLTSSSSPDANGYSWYKYDGAVNGNADLTIPATDIAGRKVILFVNDANVNITGNINLTDGAGFFMMIVKGNINVNSAVGGTGPNLEGLYFSDGIFNGGTGSTQLHVRGSVASNSSVDFKIERDLLGAANVNPSELFEYAPDQILLFPKVLGSRKMTWQEVAP